MDTFRHHNPFTPNEFVLAGQFAGRKEEVSQLEMSLHQVRHGARRNFAIIGEPGIGKTSLLNRIRSYAQAGQSCGAEDELQFITLSASLRKDDEFATILGRLGAVLTKQYKELNPTKECAKKFLDLVTRLEICGNKFNPKEAPPEQERWQMMESIIEMIGAVRESIRKSHDGIFFFIDEADQPSGEADLGSILKDISQALTTRAVTNVGFGLAGQSCLINRLNTSHQSAPRIFQTFELSPLPEDECRDVLQSGMHTANKNSVSSIAMNLDAEDWIVEKSEGYPHFLQQYAFSAFNANEDDTIDKRDVFNGAFQKNGAVEQLSTNYFSKMFAKEVVSDLGQKVLFVLAPNYERYMLRSDILHQINAEEGQVDKALYKLVEQRIIEHDLTQTDQFRIVLNSFASWIRLKKDSEKHPLDC